MSYPQYIQDGENKIKIDTDFRVALRCFDIIGDPDISDAERAMAVEYLLLGDIYDSQKVLELCIKYLQCGKKPEKNPKKPDIDLQQDKQYIVASFMSDYQIDLSSETMHWWRFMELVNGLSKNCVMSSVREIRNMNPSDYKDEKTRRKIIEAQKSVEIKPKQTAKMKEDLEEFEALLKGKGAKT